MHLASKKESFPSLLLSFFCFLICKICMFCNPLFHFDCDPKWIYSKRDDCEQNPFYPISEKLNCPSIKSKSFALNNRMFDFPILNHTNCPWCANAKCKQYDQGTKNSPAKKLEQSTIKIRIMFHISLPTKIIQKTTKYVKFIYIIEFKKLIAINLIFCYNSFERLWDVKIVDTVLTTMLPFVQDVAELLIVNNWWKMNFKMTKQKTLVLHFLSHLDFSSLLQDSSFTFAGKNKNQSLQNRRALVHS